MQRHPSRHIARAFTLIELLTVIAIIAILAAILFPIFGTVREQTRQSSTLSKMHAIYLGARLFYEDEGRFPPALYGYAETPLTNPQATGPYARPFGLQGDTTVTSMDKATGSYTTNTNLIRATSSANRSKTMPPSLMMTISDYTKLQATTAYYPLNAPHPPGPTINVTLSDGTSVTLTQVVWLAMNSTDTCPIHADIDFPCNENEMAPCTKYNGVPKYFYINDSMDIGPMIDPTNGKQMVAAGNNPIYELHYTPDWTKQLYDPTNGCDEANGKPYSTQLKYKNPPSESTIITWSTHHVVTSGSPSTLILLASGTARKINYNDGIKQLPLQYNR